MDRALRILILEDMPMDAELMEYELERAGMAFLARRVDTREAFLEALEEFRPDVILSDYSVPRFDGMTALTVARERAPGTPFLIVTGSVNEETAVRCMKAGASDYLLKSNLARIGPAIEAALARERLQAEQARAEAALRRSEANLRAIFNSSLQSFVLVDRDGVVKAFNRTADEWAQQLRGRGLEEGEQIREFLPGTAAGFAAALRGETHRLEYGVPDREGRIRWFETSDVPVVDDDGTVIGVCLSAVNIDERRRALEALAASERRFRSLVQNSSDLVVVLRDDGTIGYASDSAQRIVGRPAGDLVGANLPALLEPADAAAVRAFLDGGTGANPGTRVLEFGFPGPDGRRIALEAVASDLRSDPIIGGVVLNARDVTERKEVERALRESEERYRDLFDNASDLICLADAGGRFLYVNKAWQQAMGYGPDEIARMELVDVVHPEDRARFGEALERVLAGQPVSHLEVVFVPKGGGSLTVEGNASATREGGRPTLVRGIFRDVTERKRVEEQLRRAERMQAAGRLAGGVAHEVNNMMTGVIGFANFVLRSLPEDDGRRRDVEEIIKAGTRAADLTRQLLAFTRQQFRRPEVLDLNGVVSGMERMLRRSAGDDNELALRLHPERLEVNADRSQLEQVLINLVLNARDAITGGGRVTIETAPVELDAAYARRHTDVAIPTGPYVLLAVTDTGCGMPPEVQARAFEPFFTTKPVGQGTGLGLSTVYGIVKQNEGFIWAYSEVGRGTVFKVYLPRVTAPAGRATEPEGPEEPVGGRETILVVEDEEVVRLLASRGLREHGYRVVEARNGAEALAYLEAHPGTVDLVISDVVMPEVGGRELGRRVARLDRGVPVLYISGYTGDDVIQRGLLDPGAPFQQKPFTPMTLARTVREMLDRRPRRRAGGPSLPTA